MHPFERRFELVLWRSRLAVVLAVLCCALLALTAFVLGAIDTAQVIASTAAYAGMSAPNAVRSEARGDIVSSIVKAVDAFLVGSILSVVALGLYELFVNRIDPAENSEVAPRLLLIHSLDDLKARVARLVLLVLVVEFFGLALKLPLTTAQDLLALAAGVFLIAASLYVSDRGH